MKVTIDGNEFDMREIEARVIFDAEMKAQHIERLEDRILAFSAMFRHWKPHSADTRTRALIYADITREFTAQEIAAACLRLADDSSRVIAPFPANVLEELRRGRCE